MNRIPKVYLVKTILENLESGKIRKDFGMKPDVHIEERLLSYTKYDLIKYIREMGGQLLEAAISYIPQFPLRSSPTLYLMSLGSNMADIQEISAAVTDLSTGGYCSAFLTNGITINRIYVANRVEKCDEGVYQIELLYEKRIVITECNPVADDYMENKNVYSLERALLWIYENRHHSVLACNDFCAVKSCIDYVRKFLKIPAILPDMPEDMMQRIASGAGVRSATFSSLRPTKNVDVRTLTVYDPNLSNTALFRQLTTDVERTQKSGFFTNHPGLIRAGIGITRQYGRIWTPAHLNRTELIALSRSIVGKVDKELELLSVNNPSSVLAFYSNNKVQIDGKEITGSAKYVFLELLNYLITVNKTDSITVDRDFFKSIIKNATTLNANTTVMCTCRNCGDVEMLCEACGNRLKPKVHENEIWMFCDCCDGFVSEFVCGCGQKKRLLNHVRISISYRVLN